MANPKEKRYGQFVPITDKALNEPESGKPKIHPKGQTANSEICETCGGEIKNGICSTFRKDEPESEQQLTHYYKIIFTLKSGKQIGICSRKSYAEIVQPTPDDSTLIICGFVKTSLLVEKTVIITKIDIAAVEQIKDPCIAQVIPWPNFEGDKAEHLGIDGQPINDPIIIETKDFCPHLQKCDDSFGPLEERDKIEKPLSTHDADLSEIDGAGQDKTKGIRIGHPQCGKDPFED